MNGARTAPAWGLLGLLAASACLVLVPESDYYQAGALALPAALLAAGLAVGPIVAGFRNATALMRTEHLLMGGLVYWLLLDLVQGSYDLFGVPREAVQEGLFAILWFAAFLWLGSIVGDFVRPVRVPPAAHGDVSARFLFLAGLALFAIGTVRYLAPCHYQPQCIYDLFFYRRGASWLVRALLQLQFGDWAALVHALRFCGYLVLPMAVALRHVEGRTTWRNTLLAALGLFFLLLLIREGGRRGVGTIVLASALLWILLHARVRLKHLVGLGLTVAALLVVLQAMLVWRDVGIGTGLLEGKTLEAEDREGVVAVDRNFYYVTRIVSLIPDQHPYTGSNGVLYLMSLPIPRALWPGKPEHRGIDLPAILGKGSLTGFTITNSSVGDLYIMGGYLAISIGGLLYGILARLCSRLLDRPPTVQNRLIYAVATMTLFVSLRALSEVVITGYAVMAAAGVLGIRYAILHFSKSDRLELPAAADVRRPAGRA